VVRAARLLRGTKPTIAAEFLTRREHWMARQPGGAASSSILSAVCGADFLCFSLCSNSARIFVQFASIAARKGKAPASCTGRSSIRLWRETTSATALMNCRPLRLTTRRRASRTLRQMTFRSGLLCKKSEPMAAKGSAHSTCRTDEARERSAATIASASVGGKQRRTVKRRASASGKEQLL
jgi:hypothetical protein